MLMNLKVIVGDLSRNAADRHR